jgi:general secretion pathway protein L
MSRDSVSGQIAVEIAVARRELVDARVDQLRAWGASVQGVTVEADAERGPGPLDLLPSEQRGQRESGGERWLVPGLAVLALALLVVALLYPAYNKRSAAVALIPQVAKAKQEAEAADVIARQLERQVADYNFMVTRKQTTWPVLAYIEEVTRLLPDNTWVQQLDVKTNGRVREVQVTGETASSSKLIELLEQSSILQNAAPKGTVTRGSQPGAERFVIAAESRPRQAPPPRPLLEVTEVLPTAPPPPASGVAPPATGAPPTATLEVAPRGGPPPPARAGRDVPPERPAQPGR